MLALVEDASVDLVGEHDQVVLEGDRGDPLEVSPGEDPAGGLAGELMTIILVRGVTSEASSSGSSRKSFSWRMRDGHRRTAHEARHRFVDREAGVRVDDLVAGVDQGEDRVVHDALAADGHEDALGGDREVLAGGRVERRSQLATRGCPAKGA